DDVIMGPDAARAAGLASTVVFPVGNLAPEGAVIKATALDPSIVGDDQVYRHRGPARVFIDERDAIRAVKGAPERPNREGDLIEIVIDRRTLTGTVDLVGAAGHPLDPAACAALLAQRSAHPGLAPHPALPADTRLWAALQRVSGGTWAGCVYDVDRIVAALEAGTRELTEPAQPHRGTESPSSPGPER